ncbi:Uncharacterized protein DAT39_005594 [Clarias magur]|uniref:Uncharacterized protein n=1 Tax=Clarias magur TaxID=1594786 RepID=A0A8J4UCA6_CLAMG|nr:Uncharacterized protein DAT39_005594 [Clarias magur]
MLANFRPHLIVISSAGLRCLSRSLDASMPPEFTLLPSDMDARYNEANCQAWRGYTLSLRTLSMAVQSAAKSMLPETPSTPPTPPCSFDLNVDRYVSSLSCHPWKQGRALRQGHVGMSAKIRRGADLDNCIVRLRCSSRKQAASSLTLYSGSSSLPRGILESMKRPCPKR